MSQSIFYYLWTAAFLVELDTNLSPIGVLDLPVIRRYFAFLLRLLRPIRVVGPTTTMPTAPAGQSSSRGSPATPAASTSSGDQGIVEVGSSS